MYDYPREMCRRLLAITRGCREDMHEPDEQEIKCRVIGTTFDNAHGDDIREDAVEQGYQEIIVVLERGDYCERFNLASLIALARQARWTLNVSEDDLPLPRKGIDMRGVV